jgi:hypothetical protein
MRIKKTGLRCGGRGKSGNSQPCKMLQLKLYIKKLCKSIPHLQKNARIRQKRHYLPKNQQTKQLKDRHGLKNNDLPLAFHLLFY